MDVIIRPILTEILQSHLDASVQLLGQHEYNAYLAYLSLNPDEQGHFQRLLLRKYPYQRVDKLELSQECFNRLLSKQLLQPFLLPVEQSMTILTRSELIEQCKKKDIPSNGKKSDLIQRLMPHWQDDFAPKMVWISHRNLFQKAVQWYTSNPRGSIEQLILQELGYRQYLSKGLTNSLPIFKSRKERRLFEIARRLSPYRLKNPPRIQWVCSLINDIDTLVDQSQNPFFNPLTRLYRSVQQWAGHLAKIDLSSALKFLHLIPHQSQWPELVRKMALECQRQGIPQDGLRLIENIIKGHDIESQLPLIQSYNQMAHKIGKPRMTLPIIQAPKDREITLNQISHHKNRPRFMVKDKELSVEKAVCELLESEGHKAIFAEGVIWHALMIILFWEAFSAPLTEQLPSPVLRAPLDFQTPQFAPRRLKWIDPIMRQIENGGAIALFNSNQHHLEVTARGLESNRITAQNLLTILENFPAEALAKMMHIIIFDCQQVCRGMPDLIVFPRHDTPFSCAFPNRFRSPFLLAELKTRSDKLSPAQRIWFHRLTLANIPAELWQINHQSRSP